MTMKSCAVCEGHDFRFAAYESPGLAAALPALACLVCGSLELDDCGADVIDDALDAPHVTALSGPALRSEVQRLLDEADRYLERCSRAARGRRELQVPDEVLLSRIQGLREVVLGSAPLPRATLAENDVD